MEKVVDVTKGDVKPAWEKVVYKEDQLFFKLDRFSVDDEQEQADWVNKELQ